MFLIYLPPVLLASLKIRIYLLKISKFSSCIFYIIKIGRYYKKYNNGWENLIYWSILKIEWLLSYIPCGGIPVTKAISLG